MKYCQRCGVLYDRKMDACPKCSIQRSAEPETTAQEPRIAPRSVRIRQWIGICVGIPLLVATLYIVISALYGLLD